MKDNTLREQVECVLTGLGDKYELFDDVYKKKVIVLSHASIIEQIIKQECSKARKDELLLLTGGDWGGESYTTKYPKLKANSGGNYIENRVRELEKGGK